MTGGHDRGGHGVLGLGEVGHAGSVRWLPVDLVLVSVFAVIGRMSHAEAITVAGWWSTAWPFLTGVLLGWVVVVLTGRPGGSVPAGLVIWAATVIGGMLLRLVVDQGTAAAFVVVATLVLGLVLVGPRAGARDWQRTAPVG
jgi:hypothetical protein